MDLVEMSRRKMAEIEPGDKLILGFSTPIDEALQGLRKFMFENVYRGNVCFAERKRATIIVEFLFEYFMNNPQDCLLYTS